MLIASWLLRCSHKPSEAKITNLSSRCNLCTVIDGSELRIGLKKVSGNLNFGNIGSLLNSARFRYASPMDLVTYKKNRHNYTKTNSTNVYNILKGRINTFGDEKTLINFTHNYIGIFS